MLHFIGIVKRDEIMKCLPILTDFRYNSKNQLSIFSYFFNKVLILGTPFISNVLHVYLLKTFCPYVKGLPFVLYVLLYLSIRVT